VALDDSPLDRFRPFQSKETVEQDDETRDLAKNRKQLNVRLTEDGWRIANRLKRYYSLSYNGLIEVILRDTHRALGLNGPPDPRPLTQQLDPSAIDEDDIDSPV
jgi:hypothetical protein